MGKKLKGPVRDPFNVSAWWITSCFFAGCRLPDPQSLKPPTLRGRLRWGARWRTAKILTFFHSASVVDFAESVPLFSYFKKFIINVYYI